MRWLTGFMQNSLSQKFLLLTTAGPHRLGNELSHGCFRGRRADRINYPYTGIHTDAVHDSRTEGKEVEGIK